MSDLKRYELWLTLCNASRDTLRDLTNPYADPHKADLRTVAERLRQIAGLVLAELDEAKRKEVAA